MGWTITFVGFGIFASKTTKRNLDLCHVSISAKRLKIFIFIDAKKKCPFILRRYFPQKSLLHPLLPRLKTHRISVSADWKVFSILPSRGEKAFAIPPQEVSSLRQRMPLDSSLEFSSGCRLRIEKKQTLASKKSSNSPWQFVASGFSLTGPQGFCGSSYPCTWGSVFSTSRHIWNSTLDIAGRTHHELSALALCKLPFLLVKVDSTSRLGQRLLLVWKMNKVKKNQKNQKKPLTFMSGFSAFTSLRFSF
jgi:hypothetical protein